MAQRAADLEASFLAARDRWTRLEATTVARIQSSYRRATQALADRIAQMPPTWPVTRAWRTQIENEITLTQSLLNVEVLANIQRGIMRGATDSAVEAIIGQLGLAPLVGNATLRQRLQSTSEAEAVAWLSRVGPDGLQLSERIWNSTGTWRSAVGRLVDQGIITGQSAHDLAEDLNRYVAPAAITPTTIETARALGISPTVDAAAIRLARTEINAAARETTIMTNRTNPFYRGARWVVSPRIRHGSYPVCDICLGLAAGGPNGDGVYPRGNEPTLIDSHPNCRCSIEPVYDDLDAIEQRLGDWIEDPTSEPQVSEWFDWMQNPNPTALPPSAVPRT